MQPTRKYYEMDMISKLPPCIIENIICLLPIQEAARTSILSKEWRYHWIKIPKLEFNVDTFQVSTDNFELSVLEQTFDKPSKRKKMNKRCKLIQAINQVMLIHNGPINEFTLSVEGNRSSVGIDHILSQLSQKNTLKKLTVDIVSGYNLPLSLFSFHQLTDLYITNCAIDYKPSLNGFCNLTNLTLQEIRTDEKTLMHFLSSCPKLKNLNLNSNCISIEHTRGCTVADLFECLPMVENLSIRSYIILCFAPKKGIPKVLPTILVHLKYLCMKALTFTWKYGLPFLVLLIKSSPNLEKLTLEMLDERWPEGTCKLEDYSDIWLEHLNDLEITLFRNMKNELEFVKLILAKSPVLRKVSIYLDNEIDKTEELEMSRILMRSPRASPFDFVLNVILI